MYVNFNDLNKNSKVWVFQSSEEIPELYLDNISNDSKDFLNQLNSHGNTLKGSFKLIYNHFLVIAVEKNIQNEISGCSIDTITRFIKNLELIYNLSFFDRLIVKYKEHNNIKSTSLHEFKSICKTKKISDKITVFNNLVKNIDELDNIWETNIQNTWLKRFLNDE